jgi:hypothetical protein
VTLDPSSEYIQWQSLGLNTTVHRPQREASTDKSVLQLYQLVCKSPQHATGPLVLLEDEEAL